MNQFNETAEIRKTICELLHNIEAYLKDIKDAVAADEDKRYVYSRIDKVLDEIKQTLS